MTSEAVSKIYNAAKVTNRNNFRLEDFYYVGILRLKAGIPSPKPFIYKNMTANKGHFISACHHLGDFASYQALTDILEIYNKGNLFISIGA